MERDLPLALACHWHVIVGFQFVGPFHPQVAPEKHRRAADGRRLHDRHYRCDVGLLGSRRFGSLEIHGSEHVPWRDGSAMNTDRSWLSNCSQAENVRQ